ncbi:MAG: hypothetical protein JNK04_15350 [Myxococcales bacterium]|nr:hypothetical protein [Myxococcales bacterium]
MRDGLTFVVPTYRLRDVAQTVAEYDEHFYKHGQPIEIVVFDDSTSGAQDRYIQELEQQSTHNEVRYVGVREKAELVARVTDRLGDRSLECLVHGALRPSHGGNLNFALLHTIGDLVISADDDMRPHALMDDRSGVVLEGRALSESTMARWPHSEKSRRTFDVARSFLDVLGKPVREISQKLTRGDRAEDENLHGGPLRGCETVVMRDGHLSDDAVVKVAQTYRSGTPEIDALGQVEVFLEDEQQLDMEQPLNVCVLAAFRPAVANKHTRKPSGVVGFDNREGMPPYIASDLRIEDYVQRLWLLDQAFAVAYVDAAQHHARNPYMRRPLAWEVVGCEIATFLKRRMLETLTRITPTGIDMDYDGHVAAEEAEAILDKLSSLYGRVLAASDVTRDERRRGELLRFANDLNVHARSFERDPFEHDLAKIADATVRTIRGTMRVWPTLVEICERAKRAQALPARRLKSRMHRSERAMSLC